MRKLKEDDCVRNPGSLPRGGSCAGISPPLDFNTNARLSSNAKATTVPPVVATKISSPPSHVISYRPRPPKEAILAQRGPGASNIRSAMAWGTIPLNDGTHIPALAFGTWKRGKGDEGIGRMKQALETGIAHLDTAQAYRNELETGAAIPASGREREDVYVTTKFASLADLDASIRTSCGELGVDYVDLYLVHGPRHAQPDIPTFWKRMEAVRDAGLAKSIGVSNFTVQQLESLLASAKVKPVVNQVCIHPQVMHIQAPLLAFCAEHDIVIEGYSPCIPLEYYPEGACARLATSMGKRVGVKPEQVLLAWAKAKGVVVVTSSGRKERLQDYVAAGDIELTAEDVAAIDAAGLSEPKALPW